MRDRFFNLHVLRVVFWRWWENVMIVAVTALDQRHAPVTAEVLRQEHVARKLQIVFEQPTITQIGQHLVQIWKRSLVGFFELVEEREIGV